MSHHVTHASVSAWLEKYSKAWETYDRDLVESLWTDDAEYRWHPADEPTVGRAAIVDAWLDNRDAAGTYEGEYEPFVGNGNRAVARGTSTYWTDASRATVDKVYYNNWLLEFAEDGRCSSFTEYWMLPRKS